MSEVQLDIHEHTHEDKAAGLEEWRRVRDKKALLSMGDDMASTALLLYVLRCFGGSASLEEAYQQKNTAQRDFTRDSKSPLSSS